MFIAIMILLPLALIGAAAGLAWLSVTRSSLRITAAGVEIHNHRRPPRTVPLDEAVRFEPVRGTGNFASLRPATAVLVCVDGTRLPVRSLHAPDSGAGVDALNARLDQLRRL